MSKWQGKYVIGLTGNIGTGKSVVRRMLENLGAFGIDADALSHRAIGSDSPGFSQVVDQFGSRILGLDGEIERSSLGKLAFEDPEILSRLETIIHPLVTLAIDELVNQSRQKVIVIEAIKLLEVGLGGLCDSIWVTRSPFDIQLSRLMENRGMSESDARRRITAQAAQEQKLASAQVIINNESSCEDIWEQVLSAWRKIFPTTEEAMEMIIPQDQLPSRLSVVQGKPDEFSRVADFLSQIRPGQKELTVKDIMEKFCEKNFLLLWTGRDLAGVITWQAKNLVATVFDLVIDPNATSAQDLLVWIKGLEMVSQNFLCEVLLISDPLLPSPYAGNWGEFGYRLCKPSQLGVHTWHEAALEIHPDNSPMFFKKLCGDRILRSLSVKTANEGNCD